MDPNDPESIRAGVLRVIEDSGFREELVGRGLRNAEQYRPERIAGMYLELYRELMA